MLFAHSHFPFASESEGLMLGRVNAPTGQKLKTAPGETEVGSENGCRNNFMTNRHTLYKAVPAGKQNCDP